MTQAVCWVLERVLVGGQGATTRRMLVSPALSDEIDEAKTRGGQGVPLSVLRSPDGQD